MRNFLRSDDTSTGDETRPDENENSAMSREATAPDSDERPAYTGTQPVYGGVGYGNKSEVETAADPDADVIGGQPHPTFTPAPTESASGTNSSYVTNSAYSEPATTPVSAATPVADEPVTELPADEPVMTLPEDRPVTAVAADESVADLPADEPVPVVLTDQPVAASATVSKPVAASTVDEPLLANTELMRASWQQVQAGFVDDPKTAVADAANLIDNTVQTLVDTLRQRQRQLRDMLNGGAPAVSNSNGFDATPSDVPDTEQLRLMMHRYRSLFNQLVRS